MTIFWIKIFYESTLEYLIQIIHQSPNKPLVAATPELDWLKLK